jgi:glycosyltransferase involved in cell wall biosynthesis
MQQAPFFSVVIPTYNRAHLIKKTLQSVLAQTFTGFEILVVDDGSKDDTEAVVKSIQDSRITYYKKANGERAAARNFGTAHATGSYVTFFDSDDLMYPHHLQHAHAFIAQQANPAWLHLGFDYQDPGGNVIKQPAALTSQIQRTLLFDNKLSCNGVFIKKSVADQFPFYEDRALASSEDWELWIRLVCAYPLAFSPEITSSVVEHDLRSLNTVKPTTVEKRDIILIDRLQANQDVQRAYKKSFSRFKAERYTFFMMKYAEAKQPAHVFAWARTAALTYFPVIFTRRYLAALKNSLIR